MKPNDLSKINQPTITSFYKGVLTRSQVKTRSTTPPVMEKPKCPKRPNRKR